MGWYFISLDFVPPPSAQLPAVSLIADFSESVVIGGSFGFQNVYGHSSGNASGTYFSFSVPGGGTGSGGCYIPDSTTSLGGNLVSNILLPFDVEMILTTDPSGFGVGIAILQANAFITTIQWSGDVPSRSFTTEEARAHMRKRHKCGELVS